jgi:hypothetical protein
MKNLEKGPFGPGAYLIKSTDGQWGAYYPKAKKELPIKKNVNMTNRKKETTIVSLGTMFFLVLGIVIGLIIK